MVDFKLRFGSMSELWAAESEGRWFDPQLYCIVRMLKYPWANTTEPHVDPEQSSGYWYVCMCTIGKHKICRFKCCVTV